MNRGIGQGRGSVRAYQLPAPASVGDTLQLVSQELNTPGLHSIHVEDGMPVTVTRYTEPDDLIEGAQMTPQQILSNVGSLEEFDSEDFGGPRAFLTMLFELQRIRLKPAGIVVGSKDKFYEWIKLPDRSALSMKPLSKDCDFVYIGLKGYVDESLEPERLVILAGETETPTVSNVVLLLATHMNARE